MKKKYLIFVLSLMSMAILVGCGSKMPKELKASGITENTLYIKADGTSQVAYVSDFKENYYNEEELKSFVYKELEDYNSKYGEGTAEVSDILNENGIIKMVLTFKDSKAYVNFSKKKSENPISYPSFSKIMEEYGDLNFYSVDGEGNKTGDSAIDSEKDNVVVISGPILLLTEKKMKYYSAGKLLDKNHLKLDDKDEAVVVFSR